MEQPPGREGTIPAPSSGAGTRQLPEEAGAGDEVPVGGRESPVPAIPELAIPMPAIPEPAISEPAMPVPAIPEPAIPVPAIPEPAIPEPAIPVPANPEPAILEPAMPVPAIPEPAIPVPAIPEPAIPEPAIPMPAILEPAIPEPAIPVPAIPEPAIPEPAIPEPAIPEPAIPVPAIPVTAIPEPAIPVLAIPEPAIPEPAIPEPAIPVPAIPELAIPVPAIPEPAIPELAIPVPDIPVPAIPVPAVPVPAIPVPAGEAPHLPSEEHPRDDAQETQPAEEGGGSLPAAPTPNPGAGALGLPAEPPRARSPGREAEADFYCVKWITWKGERTPVITQSENGPCPLLAIMNILFLQWKVKLPPQKEVITAEELMAHLGDCILSTRPREPSEGLRLNFQQNINDAMMVLPKLSTGLDVNVRFTGVSDFEYTPECIVFDLLNVPLYHGWLVDPQSPEVVQAVGKLSYNQLVEKIITCKQASDSSLVSEGLVAEQFLESTASQLTYHGLCELTAAVREGELSVFFRNNHFSTMTKHKGHLYLLVTDQGFLQEEGVVWETLHNVDGDSCFCDTHFHLSHSPGNGGATATPPDPRLQQRQVDQDYLIALSLQQGQGQDPPQLSDLELARQLQQEEYQQHPHPHPQQQGRAQPVGRPAGERRQRPKPDLDCTLL